MPQPPRKRTKRKPEKAEQAIKAVQAAAMGLLAAYKILKPHINKLRKKG